MICSGCCVATLLCVGRVPTTTVAGRGVDDVDVDVRRDHVRVDPAGSWNWNGWSNSKVIWAFGTIGRRSVAADVRAATWG